VFILGGGPTLLESLEGADLKKKNVLGVNSSFCLGLWVDVCFFGDAKFYWWNRNGLDRFQGLKITINDLSKNRYRSVEGRKGINVIKRGKFKGMENCPNKIGWNKSSGAAAINVAYHLGAERIVLLGYDMRFINDKKNWKPHVREHTHMNSYGNFLKGFDAIKKDVEKLDLEILNATPDSALKAFPMVDIGKVI
jgi:hypothetical protein